MDSDDYFQCILLQIIIQEPFLSIIIVSVIILILLFLIGLLSVGDLALSSLSLEDLNEINNDKNDNSRFVKQLIENPRQTRATISVVQIINYVLFIMFSVYMQFSIFGEGFHAGLNYFLLGTGLIVVLFVCNSVIPKYIVRNKVITIACSVAPYIKFADWLFRPLTRFSVLFRVSGKKNLPIEAENLIKEYVDEKDMLREIIHFYNKTTDEIMVPRMDMKAIDVTCCFKEVLDIVMESGFSRIPVYGETEDDIKGILYVKDLLHSIRKPENFEWQSLIRPAYFIPETKKIDDLLEEFRSNKIHIAVVVDEFGCTSGLVTMEDVIEEIVGEISDEYDADKRHFFILPDGIYIFEGKIPLVDFFRETEIDHAVFGKLTDEVDTLAGLLLEIKGTLPRRRDVIDYKGYRFRILEADQRRVLKIKFSKVGKSVKDGLSCEA